MPKKRFVVYQGVRMIEGWPERIKAAQRTPNLDVNGEILARIRYGDETDDWGAEVVSCHDCAVLRDQYHVFGCDVERCPMCGGQLITCDCEVAELPE